MKNLQPFNAMSIKIISTFVRPLRVCWLALAFTGLLAGRGLAQSSAPASSMAPDVNATNDVPTYLRDIRPIFMGNCSRCHNQQSRFVYNWLDYQTAYADRWEIKRRLWDSWQGPVLQGAHADRQQPGIPLDFGRRPAGHKTMGRKRQSGWRGSAFDGCQIKGERIIAGKKLFNSICAACHQASGRAGPMCFPPRGGLDYLNADKNRAIQIVIFGRQGEVVVKGMKFNNNMPSFPLSDEDIANVLTYVYNSFGNSGLEVKPEEVKPQRSAKPQTVNRPAPKSDFE